MNDFKGLSRDTSWLKTPSDMWQFARNIILTAQYLSIANEKGNEFGFDVPGQIIGAVATNEDLLFFSIDGSYSCIGYVNHAADVYIPVVRTMNPNFKFKPSCPIEAVCMYNYKKELITVFSDGVHKNSSTPKLINLYKPQAALTPAKEFVDDDDYTMFELFSPVSLPNVNFSYDAGNLRAEVVHMAFCYVFEDDTESVISPVLTTNYPSFKGVNTIRRKISYNLFNLSSNFKKIKLFFVVKYDNSTDGYVTPILDIVDGSVEYALATVANMDIVAPEQILIPSARFSKVKTITKVDNQMLLGYVEQSNIDNYQIYANKIQLDLNLLLTEEDMEKYRSHPTLMPDEVYSVKIIPIYKDGTKANALHIPGRQAISNEREELSSNQLNDLGLDFTEFKNKGYRRFHFENSGQVLPNNSKFGYWENVDKYPNKDYYNSSAIGGEDLRGKPQRYHKIPAIDNMNFNTVWKPQVSGSIKDNVGNIPKLYLSVANFEQAFPPEVRALLQGYELVIEKRSLGGTYIETNGFLYRMHNRWNDRGRVDDSNLPAGYWNVLAEFPYPKNFSKSMFVSAETVRDSIDISATLVKCYYAMPKKFYRDERDEEAQVDLSGTNITQVPYSRDKTILSNQKLGVVVDATYKLPNNIASNNRFSGHNLALTIKQKDPSKSDSPPIDPSTTGFGSPGYPAYTKIDDFVPLAQADWDLNIIYASLITLNKNIYNLETANEFISLGIVITNNQSNAPLVAGDVFSTNIINKVFTGTYTQFGDVITFSLHNQLMFFLYNMYSPFSNHYIENGKGLMFPNYIHTYEAAGASAPYLTYADWVVNHVNKLNSFNYDTVVKAKSVADYFNTYIDALPPGLTEKFISLFPYRIYRGLDVPTESLQTNSLRFFPTNSYHDMPNDKGEIIALRGINNGVYIQQRWSLYKSVIADKITNNEQEVYLGSSVLFDRRPEEVIVNGDIGYIGSNSQFACFVFRDGYITIDEESGKIFIINNDITEASQRNMMNDFREVLPLGNHYSKTDIFDKKTKTDNPFLSVGYIVGFDKENNRILVTKKYYNPKTLTRLMDFDGEFYRDSAGNILDYNDPSYFYNESRTFSFALDSKTWVCEHDYYPNVYMYNNKGFYGIVNKLKNPAKFYRFNSDKVNNGNFFGVDYKSYVDLIFNTRLDISKQYQAIYWVSESKDNETNRLLQYKTIDEIMIYNYHQCSGIIPITTENYDNTRNVESKWQFNEFRDMLINSDTKFLKDDGTLIANAIAPAKQWFEENMFIGNFVVVRMIWNNAEKRTTYVHNVNVKSVNSNR